ncbi:MAG: hypothetical protein AAFQ94_10960 [Bacteroidota bacterium]
MPKNCLLKRVVGKNSEESLLYLITCITNAVFGLSSMQLRTIQIKSIRIKTVGKNTNNGERL